MKISVIIPVRNEEQSIRQLLHSLDNQTLAPSEIVITDGGSSDRTREIIAEYGSRVPVRLIQAASSLPGRARNLAAAAAISDWLAFTDAGNRPLSNWLETLAREIDADSDVDVVYGSYEPEIGSFFEECAVIAYVPPPFEIGSGLARPYAIVSALMRRQVWNAVGGFPEDLRSAEDLLFMRRIEQANFKIARAPKALVYWTIQPNLWRTFKRFVQYSRHNIRAGLFSEWQRTIFIYYAIVAASTFTVFVLGPKGLVAPPILWLLLLIARAMKALYRNRKSYPAAPGRNLARICLLVPILAVIDAGAFIGSIDWLLRDKLGMGKAEDKR